jgi:hypothetical protein
VNNSRSGVAYRDATKERIMYTSEVVSRAQSPAKISRRVALSALAVVVAVALIVLVLTLTTGTSTTRAGSATPNPVPSLSFSRSHIKGLDTAVSPIAAAQIMRQSVYNASAGNQDTSAPLKTQTAAIDQTHAQRGVRFGR